MTATPIRVAVVGAGPWARETHIPALAAHPGIDLTGVWTRRPEAAADLPIPRFDSIEALFDGCDAVSFAVPPAAQAPLAVAAANAGKHLILDKPIADSVATATEIVDAVTAADVRSIVTFTRRFAPETRAFVAAAQAGTYGGGLGRWISGALLGGRYASSQWRHDGGALLDVGPHVIDLLDAALGPITDVIDARVLPADDLWHITFGHDGGATSTAQLSLRVPARPTVTEFSVHGHDGVVTLTDRTTGSVECFTTLIDEFLTAITTSIEHESNVLRGLQIQHIIDTVIARVASHRNAPPIR